MLVSESNEETIATYYLGEVQIKRVVVEDLFDLQIQDQDTHSQLDWSVIDVAPVKGEHTTNL